MARGISDTNFSRGTVTIVAPFRIHFFSNVSDRIFFQSYNPIKSGPKRRAPFSSLDYNRGGSGSGAFVHRSALFVWLAVLEGTISAVLLHLAQNPLSNKHTLSSP